MGCAFEDQPLYVVFAGINGAGKSTLYRSGLWRKTVGSVVLERINPDEILRERGGDPADALAQLKAGREAVVRIEACLASRTSFNQETTLSGKSSVNTIKRAKTLGYHVAMYYVGVDSIEVARRRIAHRAELGGHDIAPELVKRRFERSAEHMLDAVELCDEAYLFDNTVMFEHVATVRNGAVEENEAAPVADWAHALAERVKERLEMGR